MGLNGGVTRGEKLPPERLRSLFAALDAESVREWGLLPAPLELLVVGGAAVSLQWNPRRLTRDVDVVSEGLPASLWRTAARVAEEQEGVQTDWLNDAAKIGALSPLADADPTLIYEGRNIRVHGAGARYVMAMKLVAGREIDLSDLPTLLGAADFESLDEALDWVARAHAHRLIPVGAQYILEEAWEAHIRKSAGSVPS